MPGSLENSTFWGISSKPIQIRRIFSLGRTFCLSWSPTQQPYRESQQSHQLMHRSKHPYPSSCSSFCCCQPQVSHPFLHRTHLRSQSPCLLPPPPFPLNQSHSFLSQNHLRLPLSHPDHWRNHLHCPLYSQYRSHHLHLPPFSRLPPLLHLSHWKSNSHQDLRCH